MPGRTMDYMIEQSISEMGVSGDVAVRLELLLLRHTQTPWSILPPTPNQNEEVEYSTCTVFLNENIAYFLLIKKTSVSKLDS
jgi:hypothetical protein